MDIQAEKNWIISELNQVKDPQVIKALKKLLQARDVQNEESAIDPTLKDVLSNRAKQAEEDIEAGRLFSSEEMHEKLVNCFSR